MTVKFIDLFAGIGGFRLGLERASSEFKCVWSNEYDKYAAQVYSKHFGECDTRDITTIPTSEIPDFDLLCGGFPCQAFSVAGKRRGFDDPRGTLFFEIARIVKEHKPLYLLLENVKGLVSHDGGKTLETILETLQQLGYYTNIEVCNSKDFGVPQTRERIFFLCRRVNVLESVGQSQKMTSSEKTIQEWLFQLLLNNLKEVEKLQGQESKDWVVGYLLLKEIGNAFGQTMKHKLSENTFLNQSEKCKNFSPTNPLVVSTTRLSSLEEKPDIRVGTMMGTEEKLSPSTEDMWQSIDLLLRKYWEENYSEQKSYTTSTAIKQIIAEETYTYSHLLLAILIATVQLRNLSKSCWNEILSSLTLIKENTKYARVNDKTEEAVVTEDGVAHLSANLQDPATHFIVGHSRGTPRPQVFPIRADDQVCDGKGGQANLTANTLTANCWKGPAASRPLIAEPNEPELKYVGGIVGKRDMWLKDGKQNSRNFSQGQRVYSTDGIASTLAGNAGGLGGKTGLYLIAPNSKKIDLSEIPDRPFQLLETRTEEGKKSRREIREKEGRDSTLRGKDFKKYVPKREDLANCLTTGKENIEKWVFDMPRIRRLTPVECERLQGFPDNWTQYGADGETISDTQRYKMMGNAVTTNVVQAIVERLVNEN